MKQISKLIKCVPVAIIWLLSTPLLAQNVQVNFASNRDSVGTEGDIVRIPILLDTVHTDNMVGENIIALKLTFSHDADLSPQSFDFAGGLIESWSINTTISSTNNRFTITAAGVNPIALDSGLLFYVDYLLNDVTQERNPNYTLYASADADNYFNEGGYDFTMDYGQIKIKPILQLNTSASPVRITVGDSTRIFVSGGTAPYTYSLEDPTFGTIVSEQYFLADRHGFAEVLVEDANGLQGSTTVEVRPFRLGMQAPENLLFPGEGGVVYVTTTDISSYDIVSGEFKFYFGNKTNVQFLNADATGFLLDGFSIEVQPIASNQYHLAFAGTTSIGAGDTLMALHFNVLEEPASTSESVYVVDNTITFNEDLLGNSSPSSSIRFIDLVKPTISFSGGNYITGDQIQFTGSGGTAPYTWSVSNEEIATIDGDGLLSVHRGGLLTVTITDDLGATKEAQPNLFDGRLDIADHSAPVGSEYLLPIELTELPTGRDFSAFSFDFTYDTSKITYMGAVKANALTQDFTVVENALNGVKHRVVGGNTVGVNGPGDFIYLSFLIDKLSENASTTITLNQIQLNEGSPIVIEANGSIKAAFSPTTHDTTIVINEDELLVLSADNFPFDHPDENRTFGSVRILSLPETGSLNYFSSPVSVNQQFALSNLANVTYQPSQDESGAGYASFKFEVIDDASVKSNYPAVMTFDVTSVNDAPSFEVSESFVTVDEDFDTPSVINFSPNAVPTDEQGETITYSISPEMVDFANVVFDSNAMTVTFSSVADSSGSQAFTITADDGQAVNNVFEKTVTLTVQSVNDAPTFNDQTFAINENLGNGSLVGEIIAEDKDSDLSFTITAGNTNNAFALSNDGLLTVNDFNELDFETTPTFSLSIDVMDELTTVSATITVNLNNIDESVNQAPQITSQTFSIDENSPDESAVGTVDSFDPDGDALTYSITGGNTNGAFTIDASSGELTVANSSELNFETTPVFSLTIQVADAELNASATITINLNDLIDTNQAPTINDQAFSINENSANGTSVAIIVAADPNEDALTYSITAGNTNSAFSIDASSGKLTVTNVAELDFETTPTFSLIVQVADAEFSASATITVNLNNVDESVNQAPQIVAQTFSIDENSPDGSSVGTVNSFDPDNDVLTYSITAGNTNGAFAIDGSTGDLMAANSAELDFEVTPSFSLTIQVADAALNASATITVNLNDLLDTNQTPTIADQTFSINENSANGTSVATVVASDPDGDALTYSITAGNTNGAFAIDASSGELTVANSNELDFEPTPTFSLTVQVADAEFNASATITINLNDVDETVNQAPQIVAQAFSIDENSANGTSVATVVASDPDGDALTYSITAGNTNGAFAIDASSGELTVANSSELDFEPTPIFSLTVQVADAEFNASATITINLNDVDETVNQAPQIVAQTFNIDENSATGTSVATVVASDPDGDALTYSITAGNTNGAFAIDASSGELTVANSSELDFETIPTFSLTIQVADAELNASATITINLNDIDESVNQAPQINAQNFSIDENSTNGTSVATVVASDPDGDALTYSITAGNTNTAFAIDGSTGALTVANVAELDFETIPTFTLTVQVADAELNAVATITINLNDVEETALGMSEVVKTKMMMYPNPVVDRVILEYPHELLEGKWSLLTTEGKVLFGGHIEHNKDEVNVSSLTNGVYILRIVKEDISFSLTVIKR